jgi:hypothetical protein
VTYRSRGLGEWDYAFVPEGVAQVRDFDLVMNTDFGGFDFPAGAISPTANLQSIEPVGVLEPVDHAQDVRGPLLGALAGDHDRPRHDEDARLVGLIHVACQQPDVGRRWAACCQDRDGEEAQGAEQRGATKAIHHKPPWVDRSGPVTKHTGVPHRARTA